MVTVPTFGFGIMPRGPKAPYPDDPTSGIMSGVRDDLVEIDIASLNLLNQVLGAHHVGSGLLGFFSFRTLGEYGHAGGAARAMGQRAYAAGPSGRRGADQHPD